MLHKIAILFLSAFCLCLPVAAEDSAPVVADGFAALVNDRVVTVGDVLMLVREGDSQRRALYEGEELEQKLKEDFSKALDALIERALILEDFEQIKAEIPARLIDDHMETVIRDSFDNDRGAFLSALSAERTTLEEYREQVKERLIIVYSRQQILQGKIFVAPSAVRRAYEERIDTYRSPEAVHFRMIVIKGGETEEERAAKKAEAESVHKQILDGADFAEMAEAHSEDSRARQGGDRGWTAVMDLGTEFAEALKPMDPGAVSGMIEAGNDFYILKLEERRAASVKPLDEVKEEIAKELRNAEEKRIYGEWIGRLRKKHMVKMFQ